MTIAVQHDGRVLVNFIQFGVQYSSVALANQEAAKLQRDQFPKAKLIPCQIDPPPAAEAVPLVL